MYAKSYFIRHPERSEAESNFFVLDPKRHCVPFAPHCVRSSTTLRMTQTKKCRAKRGRIYEQSTQNVRNIIFISTPHPSRSAPPVSLRLGHARGKTTLSCFLRPSRRFATHWRRLFIRCFKLLIEKQLPTEVRGELF